MFGLFMVTLQGWFDTAHYEKAIMTSARQPLAVAYEPMREVKSFSVDAFSSEAGEKHPFSFFTISALVKDEP